MATISWDGLEFEVSSWHISKGRKMRIDPQSEAARRAIDLAILDQQCTANRPGAVGCVSGPKQTAMEVRFLGRLKKAGLYFPTFEAEEWFKRYGLGAE